MTDARAAEYVRSLAVPVYDTGPDGRLKLGAALRMAEVASEAHVELLNAGYGELRRRLGMVFVAVSTRVRIARMPARGERITVKTHPRGLSRAEFYRDFLFYDAAEKPLLSVMQTTVLANAETHRPRRPQAIRALGVEINPETAVPREERMERLAVPEGLPAAGERRVFRSDLDANGHMNNCVYGDIVSDFLPEDVRAAAREVQIRYAAETRLGETLAIRAGRAEGAFLMVGETARGVRFTARVRG